MAHNNVSLSVKFDVEDILCTAFESGAVGYWAGVKSVGLEEDDCYAPEGWAYQFTDIEEGDDLGVLNQEKLEKGVSLFFSKMCHQIASTTDFCSEGGYLVANFDGDAVDSIIQLALMDDVVYG